MLEQEIKVAYNELHHCSNIDRIKIKKRLRNISKIKDEVKFKSAFDEIVDAINLSKEKQALKASKPLSVRYPEGLPISASAEELLNAIQSN